MREWFFIKLFACWLCICFYWQPILWWRCSFWSSQRLSDIMFLPVWYWSYRKRYSIRKGKCICLLISYFFSQIVFIYQDLSELVFCLFVDLSWIILWFICQTPFLVQSGPNNGTQRKMISCWTQGNITARYNKVASTVFFFISLSLYGTNIPHKYSIFIQQLNLLHLRKIFPKHLWDWEPCCETVRNEKKLWDSQQNRESWQAWVRVHISWVSFSC